MDSFYKPAIDLRFTALVTEALPKAGYDCFVSKIYMRLIVYADDITLLSSFTKDAGFYFHKGKEVSIIFNY